MDELPEEPRKLPGNPIPGLPPVPVLQPSRPKLTLRPLSPGFKPPIAPNDQSKVSRWNK